MWTKQQAHWMLKYILKLSLLTPHAPAKHRNALVRANRDLTATGTPTLPEKAGSRGQTMAHRYLIAWC